MIYCGIFFPFTSCSSNVSLHDYHTKDPGLGWTWDRLSQEASLFCWCIEVAGSSFRRQQRRVRASVLEIRHRVAPLPPPTAVVTGVHLTFQCHKNKLVSYETYHRDKTICGDVQRLLSTELCFGDGDLPCLRHQEFLDDGRIVFSKLRFLLWIYTALITKFPSYHYMLFM
jgi:hypothetical protein